MASHDGGSSQVIGSTSRISENESVSNSKTFHPACQRSGNVLHQRRLPGPGKQQLSVARAVRIHAHLEVPEKARCKLRFVNVNKYGKRMTEINSASVSPLTIWYQPVLTARFESRQLEFATLLVLHSHYRIDPGCS